MANLTKTRRRPAAQADPFAMPRVLPVTRPGRCAAASGAGVFDQVEATDPFLSVDVFRRTGACIPPHPHAGCAVALYLFPDADTGLRSRHAHGGDDLVEPGDLLWLDTHCGVVHEDVPLDPAAICAGVRLVVNRAGRHGEALQRVVPATQMPVWSEGAVDFTLVCGQWLDHAVAREQAEDTTLMRLEWRADELRTLSIPDDGRRWMALLVRGEAALAGHTLRVGSGDDEALMLPPGDWQLAGRAGTRLMLAGGTPLAQPVVYRGNFAASDESDLVNLLRRYQQGAMGVLSCAQPQPSP